MRLPDHLFVSDCDGCLYRTDAAGWHSRPPLRENYMRVHAEIKTAADLKATLRHGPTVWPGGYSLVFYTNDGSALSFGTVKSEFARVVQAIKDEDVYSGWLIVACDINWEDDALVDAHTGDLIPPEYGSQQGEGG